MTKNKGKISADERKEGKNEEEYQKDVSCNHTLTLTESLPSHVIFIFPIHRHSYFIVSGYRLPQMEITGNP